MDGLPSWVGNFRSQVLPGFAGGCSGLFPTGVEPLKPRPSKVNLQEAR